MAEEELVAGLREAVNGTYELGPELGGGGMSRVFRATERSNGRPVAIKLLPPDLAVDISLARFKREIDVAGRMQHPNIVPVITSGEASGLPWFAMPFIEGASLREHLTSRGALPIPDALRVLRDMASALAYAHRRGVVHRDIKPENVIVSGSTAMILDFGVAKALLSADASPTEDAGPKLTTRRIALGTPTYMSPEQASGDPRVGTRADIYTWGIVGYELVAGRTPFEGRSLHGQLRAHVREEPVSLATHQPNAPAYLVDLIMRCLAKAPADRPQLAEALVEALDAGSGGETATSAPAVPAVGVSLTSNAGTAPIPTPAGPTATVLTASVPTASVPTAVAPASTPTPRWSPGFSLAACLTVLAVAIAGAAVVVLR